MHKPGLKRPKPGVFGTRSGAKASTKGVFQQPSHSELAPLHAFSNPENREIERAGTSVPTLTTSHVVVRLVKHYLSWVKGKNSELKPEYGPWSRLT